MLAPVCADGIWWGKLGMGDGKAGYGVRRGALLEVLSGLFGGPRLRWREVGRLVGFLFLFSFGFFWEGFGFLSFRSDSMNRLGSPSKSENSDVLIDPLI